MLHTGNVPPLQRPLVVEFDETLADIDARADYSYSTPFYRRHFEKHLRQNRSRTAGWIVMCGLMAMGLGGLLLNGDRLTTHVFSFCFGVLVGLMAYSKRLTRSWYTEYVRAYVRRGIRAQEGVYPRRVSIAMTVDGIDMSWPKYEMRVGWAYVWLVAETATHVVVVTNGLTGVAIPIGAFPSAADGSAFAAEAKALMDRAGESDGHRRARFLTESSVNCPGCKYPLNGVVAEKCPECGRQIDYSELRELAAARNAKLSRRTRSFQIEWPWSGTH